MTSNADTLTAAIRAETVVEFGYKKGLAEPARLVTFSPWELSEDGESIIGYDHGRDGIRRFSISKITGDVDGAATDEHYVLPQV